MRRLLVIDDEEEIRKLLSRFFTDRNYEVVAAASGEKGLEVIDTLPIDAVLLDISMPGMSGLEVLREIRSRKPELPVIMVTAESDRDVAASAVKDGAFDYLVKPPDFDYLAQTLFVKLELRLS